MKGFWEGLGRLLPGAGGGTGWKEGVAHAAEIGAEGGTGWRVEK